jgi:hypothetical protein
MFGTNAQIADILPIALKNTGEKTSNTRSIAIVYVNPTKTNMTSEVGDG